MNDIRTPVHSIDDIHALGREYLIVWCIVYDGEQTSCDALAGRLRNVDCADSPSGLLFVNSRNSTPLVEQLPQHSKRPVIMAFGGGFCILTIDSEAEFDSKVATVQNFAEQFKKSWLVGRG